MYVDLDAICYIHIVFSQQNLKRIKLLARLFNAFWRKRDITVIIIHINTVKTFHNMLKIYYLKNIKYQCSNDTFLCNPLYLRDIFYF